MAVPLLTIGLPVYNAQPRLQDALRSIFAQTFSDWELIVIDDGSSDDSLELLQKLHDARVRLLRDGHHRGLAARLNQIVSEARGQFVVRMDADDLMDPERVARQLGHLEHHPEVDVLGCSMLVLGRDSQPIGIRRVPLTHEDVCARLPRSMGLAHATAFARTDWWRAHPYREHCACEDQDLWFSTYVNSYFANLPDPLYFYREMESFSAAKHAHACANFISVLWRWRGHFGWVRTLGAITREVASAGLYAAASRTGLAPSLLRRRNTRVDRIAQERFQSAMTRIRATALPIPAALAAGSIGR